MNLFTNWITGRSLNWRQINQLAGGVNLPTICCNSRSFICFALALFFSGVPSHASTADADFAWMTAYTRSSGRDLSGDKVFARAADFNNPRNYTTATAQDMR